ncbi:MAG: putative DNA binding domain-containing protein [Polyangiaceae bacterium]|jgi:ATP-dependent DNA helicase RecG|nr:putative DNA binding domain-containing protein [Polyangiaceae bacterium]
MDEEQLQRLLATEDDRTEWKESTRDANDIFRSICALANDLGRSYRPGFLLVGVNNRGELVGVPDHGNELDAQQKRVSEWIHSTKLLPTPSCDVMVKRVSGKALLVVRVEPYRVPPVVQVNGVAWIRSGSTTRRATEADLARLRKRRPDHMLPFDTRVMSGATLDDLDATQLRLDYEAAREMDSDRDTFPELERWLTQLELGRPVEGRWAPNTAAILVHGRSPQTFLPGAVIEFARYGGIDVSAPVAFRKTIMGTLPDQLQSAWALLSAIIADVPADVAGIREGFVPEYPLEALKELVRNLVQHRQLEATHAPRRIEWYDDRIELSNTGGPFGRASEGEFGTHADYRNPSVTRLLVRLGYVQKLGRGVRLARLALQRNGNPPFEAETDGFTRVVVRRRP